MIRLKDIARRAGVSLTTVSKVIHNAPDVSGATKTRVLTLAREMGYVPDSVAQGLRSRTTRLLGLVISAMTNPIFSRITMGIEEQTRQIGYDLILAHTQSDPAREEAIIRRLLSRRVDGIFISPVYRLAPTAPIYDNLLRHKTPVVLLSARAGFCQHFVNVEPEDLLGAFAATKHLLELGHRRIALLTGPAADPAAMERREGYHRALREAGIEQDESLVFNAGNTIEDGERASLQMVDEACRATALFAFNDLVAMGAINVLMSQGMKIPHDISVVGFGNISMAEHFKIPLTTITQPKYRLGLAAVEIMQKLLRGQSAESRRLPTDLVIRASTAPPSGRAAQLV